MPRIRSIHPGFWTDEDVVSVSRDARLLYIGLWSQCDDKGVFEWKPRSIKMRLFPSDDDVHIEQLLGELHRVGLIAPYTTAGHKYGAVKNFQRFQRPKKPNDVFPLPQRFLPFVFGTGSEPVGKLPRRGRRKEGGDSPPKGGARAGKQVREARNAFVDSAAEDMGSGVVPLRKVL